MKISNFPIYRLLLLTPTVISDFFTTENASVSEIIQTRKEDLSLIIMGDTQYHYKCEPANIFCKIISRRCREAYGLDYNLWFNPSFRNETVIAGALECTKMESRFANRVQRQALDKLIAAMRYPPSALIIDGDLTDFGHMHQFQEFERTWLQNFPIPILAGLGNHDYENNVGDCLFNHCAHTMLMWLTNFAKNMSVELDSSRSVKSAFEVDYRGSFSYSTRICSVTGVQCAQLIQLHNAIDYETSFSSFLHNWNVTTGVNYLKTQLRLLKNVDLPVLINMHQCEGVRLEKMKQVIGNWIYETRNVGHQKRVAVFFAHMHSKHEVRSYCFHGVSVPFVYVGSVPNNRFSMLVISKDGSSLSGLSARQSYKRRTVEDLVENFGSVSIWGKCEEPSRFPFTDPRSSLILPEDLNLE